MDDIHTDDFPFTPCARAAILPAIVLGVYADIAEAENQGTHPDDAPFA